MLFYNDHGVKITTHVQERLILDVIRRIVLSIKIDDIQNNVTKNKRSLNANYHNYTNVSDYDIFDVDDKEAF